jgi:hypothetical protein
MVEDYLLVERRDRESSELKGIQWSQTVIMENNRWT